MMFRSLLSAATFVLLLSSCLSSPNSEKLVSHYLDIINTHPREAYALTTEGSFFNVYDIGGPLSYIAVMTAQLENYNCKRSSIKSSYKKGRFSDIPLYAIVEVQWACGTSTEPAQYPPTVNFYVVDQRIGGASIAAPTRDEIPDLAGLQLQGPPREERTLK